MVIKNIFAICYLRVFWWYSAKTMLTPTMFSRRRVWAPRSGRSVCSDRRGELPQQAALGGRGRHIYLSLSIYIYIICMCIYIYIYHVLSIIHIYIYIYTHIFVNGGLLSRYFASRKFKERLLQFHGEESWQQLFLELPWAVPNQETPIYKQTWFIFG